MPIAVGRQLAVLEDAPTAKMMDRKVTNSVAEEEEEVAATGRILAVPKDAPIAKTTGRQATNSVAAEEGAEEVVLQGLPAIGTAVVVRVRVGKKTAPSSARRRRGATTGCVCPSVRHPGPSITWVPRFGRHPRLAIPSGLIMGVAESVFC